MDCRAFIARLRRQGFVVSSQGADRLLVAPRAKLTAADIRAIRENKWRLLALVLNEERESLIRAREKDGEMLVRLWNRLHQSQRLTDWAMERRAAAPPAAPALSPDLLGKAIRLCHPDRHPGSESANQVTAALLQLREQGRAGV